MPLTMKVAVLCLVLTVSVVLNASVDCNGIAMSTGKRNMARNIDLTSIREDVVCSTICIGGCKPLRGIKTVVSCNDNIARRTGTNTEIKQTQTGRKSSKTVGKNIYAGRKDTRTRTEFSNIHEGLKDTKLNIHARRKDTRTASTSIHKGREDTKRAVKNMQTGREDPRPDGKNIHARREDTKIAGKNMHTGREDPRPDGKNIHARREDTKTEGRNTSAKRSDTRRVDRNIQTKRNDTRTVGRNIQTKRNDTRTVGRNIQAERKVSNGKRTRTRCLKYGKKIKLMKGRKISGYNHKDIYYTTIEECELACLNLKEFFCKSFDFRFVFRSCSLSRYGYFDVPKSRRKHGQPQRWTHGLRVCEVR